MNLKIFTIILTLFASQIKSHAHGSWQQHADDMYEVFGFQRNEELTNWMRFVSSVLIDNNNSDCAFSDDGKPFNFYAYLQEKYPDFQCKHRLLFHWGYNSRPWTTYLQDKVEYYGWSEEKIKEFQSDLVAEQKRRNRYANEYTETVFGFAHGGKEARIARVLISIAYDVHLLGDYEPDNRDLDGLQEIGSVVGDIVNNIQALDKQNGTPLSKQLKKLSQSNEYNVQDLATELLNILKSNFSNLLRYANGKEIANHLHAKGYCFVDEVISMSEQVAVEEKYHPQKETKTKKKRTRMRQSHGGIGMIVVISLAMLVALFVLLFKKNK